MSLLRYTTLFLILPLAACGKGPEKVSAPPEPADSHAGHGHGPMGGAQGQMPNDATHGGIQSPHGVQNQTGEIKLIASGEVELAGDFAGVAEGWLFVTSHDTATGAFGHSAKVEVAAGSKNAAGNQVVPFKLTTGDFAMGVVSDDSFSLKVMYDHDGFIESKSGNGTQIVPATNGQSGIVIKLEKID
jgi:hypothetical protein